MPADRVTRVTLDRRILFLNQHYGLGLVMDKDIVGWRVQIGNRNLSPRQSLHSTITWLEAFESGIEIGKEINGNNSRQ